MNFRLTPAATMAIAAAAGIVLACAAMLLAVRQPWLGLNLSPQAEYGFAWIDSVDPAGPAADIAAPAALLALIGSNGDRIEPLPVDLIEDPDRLATYAEMRDFLDRQSRLSAILAGRTVIAELHGVDGESRSASLELYRHRPLSDLPFVFWVQAGTGLASFLIGIWVWSLRRGEPDTRLFAVAGAGLMLSALAAAVYSTRELAMDGVLLRVLSGINHASALVFGAAMIGLFLSYPRRLVEPGWLAAPGVILGLWLIAGLLELPPGPPVGIHLPVTLAMIAILACAGLQYWRARADVRARAALGWFALAVAVGAGAFVITIVAPNVLGIAPTISQGYAFPLFLLIYAGVALGVARYRLFELGDWAFRILFYLFGAVLLILLDAVLIYAVAVERAPAFGLSLLIVGFLYLPLRTALGRRLSGQRQVSHGSLFRHVVDVALAPPGTDRAQLWRQFVQNVFDPLRMEISADVASAALQDDGAALLIPGAESIPALRLEHADGGRRLFSMRDANLAGELHAMLRHAADSRDAFEQGAMQERERIALDIHDNIGVQLLGALHSHASERKDTMIRETLSDLRDIINNASRPGLSFDEMLADLRVEIAEHLASVGARLCWSVKAQDAQTLPPQTAHTLRSIIREATGNAIKHASASRLAIDIALDAGIVAVGIEDDGTGFDLDSAPAGNGLSNMRTRVTSLDGTFKIEADRDGTRIAVRIPIQPGAPCHEPHPDR